VVDYRREAFFGGIDVDFPKNRPLVLRNDDLTPQLGYVGESYRRGTGVLFLGINPGNGPDVRSKADEQMMPALISFAENPSPKRFDQAQKAYEDVCVTWRVWWRRRCSEVFGPGKLELEEVAYSNCLPWRTESGPGFGPSVQEKAAKLYVYPLIEELQPKLIIALGKCATKILHLAGQEPPRLITWNCAQAATPAVLEERAKAAAEILTVLGRRQGN
jgi:hypothetical protein